VGPPQNQNPSIPAAVYFIFTKGIFNDIRMAQSPLLGEEGGGGGGSRSNSKAAFARTWTEQFAFPAFRTNTESGFRLFSVNPWDAPQDSGDEAWTESLLNEFITVTAEGGVDGEIPSIAPGFGKDRLFWVMIALAIVYGLVNAFMGIFVLNMAEGVPKLWTYNGEFDDPDDCKLYSGKKMWILVPLAGGILVGILRYLGKYPNDRPGFFKEVNDCHVDYKDAPLCVLLSSISLGCGTSLGPEQALGTFGGGLATYVVEHYGDYLGFVDEDDKKLSILSGFAAAMGGLFPTPILACTIISELGNPPKGYMEHFTLFSVAALANFVVYNSLAGYTYIDLISKNLVFALAWEFKQRNMGTAVVIGIVSGLTVLVTLVFMGICKKIFARIRMRCDTRTGNTMLGEILCPTIGGLAIGCMAWAVPLTIGDGNMVLNGIVKFGSTNEISRNVLVCSLFGKMFTLAVSMSSGFVGGFIFPLITISVLMAMISFSIMTNGLDDEQNDPDQPLGLYISCFMAAIPGAIAPMPVTMVFLAASVLFFNLTQLAPIFLSVITSYLLVCGSGIFERMQKRAQAQPGAGDAGRESGGGGHGLDENENGIKQKTSKVIEYGRAGGM